MIGLTNISTQFIDEYIVYEMSFSTADIEAMLFYEDSLHEPGFSEIVIPEGEYRLIGDELMRVDKKNLTPDSIITS